MNREILTTRAHGIDCSHYQEKYDYNKTWGQVDFAIQKMGEGAYIESDIRFHALWDGGTSQVAVRGLYFYQRLSVDWKKQADNILRAAARADTFGGIHIIALDTEEINNSNRWGGIDTNLFVDARNILQYVKEQAKQKVVWYTNTNCLIKAQTQMTKRFGKLGASWINDYPLWFAQYYWTRRSPDRQPLVPKIHPNWSIWQYTDRGDSTKLMPVEGTGNMTTWRHYGSPDLNVYNGTLEEMKTWVGINA